MTSHDGEGTFGAVGAVLRTNTRGGALAGPCAEAGTVMNVPYEADYVFLKRP